MAILIPLDVQYFNDDGTVAAGKQMFTYIAGSSTKTTTWTDATGGTPNANPIALDSAGRPPGGNGIWGISGVTYDMHLASATDTDPPTGATIDYDGMVGNETPTSTQSEWIASGQDGTYISATSFSVEGNQTAIYEVDMRLKIVDGGGSKYCTIVSATFGAVTTIVTKGDALAASITAVSYGLLTSVNDGMSRKAQTHTEGAAIASATTTDIGASTGDTVHITGTTTITGLGSAQRAGVVRRLVFDGVLILTNGASLIIPGGANITTAAGDTCTAVSEDGAGAWRIHTYTPSAGSAALSGADFTGHINTARATVASHATTSAIWAAAGNEIDFTGTATLTDLPAADQAGSSRILHIAAACTFTDNANLDVQGGTFTAAIGDVITIHAVTTTTFKVMRQMATGLGKTLQVAQTITGAYASGTTVIPSDDTIPQNDEGEQFMTLAFTPLSATSTLYIEAMANGAGATGVWHTVAVFQDAVADTLCSGSVYQVTNNGLAQIKAAHSQASVGLTAITFNVRAGTNNTAGFYFNGSGGARLLGGTMKSYIIVTEVEA